MSAISLAISLSGLQSYRFGRQVTIPFSYGDYLPTSPLKLIYLNKKNDLHSLVLLDLDPSGLGIDLPKPMNPNYAVKQLKLMVEKISPENSVFIGGESFELNDTKVYRYLGMGQTHFVFADDKALVWLSAETIWGEKFLSEYLSFLN